MQCKIVNNAGIDLSDLEQHIQGMYAHFDDRIGFKKPPTLFFDSDPSNASKTLGKTAYYDPQSHEVHVYVDGRHPKDMLRSIAHELIHHQQNLEGRLNVGGYQGEGYYLENKEMQKLEQEAMLNGNAYLREYEDKLKLEENKKMSIKDWKNKELFENLAERWGFGTKILNEGQSVRHGAEDRDVGRDRVQPDRQHEELELEEELEEGMCQACQAMPCGCVNEELEEKKTPEHDAEMKAAGFSDAQAKNLPDELQKSMLGEEELEERKQDCFELKTFDGKVKCIMKQKNIGEERASAYVADVMRKMGELEEGSAMAAGSVAGPANNLEEKLREAIRAVLESNEEIKAMLKGRK